MRVLYFSDIHIEFVARQTRPVLGWTDLSSLQLGPNVSHLIGSVDLAVLAGDIGMGSLTNVASAVKYAEQLSSFLHAPVVLVPGNHEYYGGKFYDYRQAMLHAASPGVSVLDRGEVFFDNPSGQLRVLGATLWTDYNVHGDAKRGMQVARYSINDHRRIEMSGNRPFLPEDALDEHLISRRWLEDRLRESHDGPTLIVTHHVPHPVARNPRFEPTDPYSPAFQSNCSDTIALASEVKVSAWIFGHHHYTVQTQVQGVPLLSAQIGYPGEDTGWAGPPIIDI